jgi:AcrR family transcriptional regulator
MRAIAERVEYSPGAIYLYFRDKDDLILEVVRAGFVRMREYAKAELETLPGEASAMTQYAAMGRAYARFAIENTAYFRVMFELPGVPQLDCPQPCDHESAESPFADVVRTVERASREGMSGVGDARRTALIGWGLIHGLTSLYLSGHFADKVSTHEEFLSVVEDAMQTFYAGWRGAPAAV